MVNSTATIAERAKARRASSTPETLGSTVVSTARYLLLAHMVKSLELLGKTGYASIEAYYDFLDSVRLHIVSLDETVSIKVAMKRSQEYINSRNNAERDALASTATAEDRQSATQDAEDFDVVVKEIFALIEPYGINQSSYGSVTMEGHWYYGNLKDVDDELVDGLPPKQRVQKKRVRK
jgi:hypothetical protein